MLCSLNYCFKNKLGLESEEEFEILDLRIHPKDLESLIDNKKYFAGYHMNKQRWCPICLDVSIELEEFFKLLDDIFVLAVK